MFIWRNKIHQDQRGIREALKFSKIKYVRHAQPKKSQSKLYAENKSRVAKDEKLKTKQVRVKLFKKQIREGPYFICTICHLFFIHGLWGFFLRRIIKTLKLTLWLKQQMMGSCVFVWHVKRALRRKELLFKLFVIS